MRRERAFGELELAVIQAIRAKGRATVREVFEALGEKAAYTTIMTVMFRLYEKGELSRERIGRQYEYMIAEKKTSSELSILQRIKKKIFGGDATAMVTYLLETDKEISDTDLASIRKLIEGRRKKK